MYFFRRKFTTTARTTFCKTKLNLYNRFFLKSYNRVVVLLEQNENQFNS
jgi:hypothetical protein